MVDRYEPEDVRRELLYLRKGQGFTAERLQRAAAVRGVLGGINTPYGMLRERFESAITSLRDDDAELLGAVFGLSPETADMRRAADRRDFLGAKLGIGREAVADRDADAIERLLVQLITGWYPKSPTGIRTPESHNGVVQHAVRITTVVRDRKLLETNHHYRFFAVFDGAEYVAVSTVATELPIPSGDFTLRTVETTGGLLHQFWHTTPMQRGQTYDLKFRVPGVPDDPYWLTEESLAFHEPARFAVFETVFIGEKPSMVWKFGRLTALERPGTPSKEELLDLGQSSSVKAEFHDLHGGLFHGVAWEW